MWVRVAAALQGQRHSLLRTASSESLVSFSLHFRPSVAMHQPLPPLTQVHATITHVAPSLLALPHIVHTLTTLLDVSISMSLPTAASTGSISVVDRVVRRLLNTHDLSPALLNHWYAQAMQVAIKRDDLAMIEKIHALHPEPLVLDSLQLAMQYGCLETVQWIVEHRHDRLCCAPGIKNLCTQCGLKALHQLGRHDSLRVVQWLTNEGFPVTQLHDDSMPSPLDRAMVENCDLLYWLAKQGLIDQHKAETLLFAAISGKTVNGVDIIQCLLTLGYSMTKEALIQALIQGSCQSQNESVVEFVVSSRLCESMRAAFKFEATQPGGSNVLQWSQDFIDNPANVAVSRDICSRAVDAGHCDTMRWIQERGLLQVSRIRIPWLLSEDDVMQFISTIEEFGLASWSTTDADNAAAHGYLKVLQRLLSHDGVSCTTQAMDMAAGNGHLHVVKWLHQNRTEGCTGDGMVLAADRGHLEVVKWLCENSSEHNTTEAMACAASDGQLEVVMWLYDNQDDGCTSCATQAVLDGVAVGRDDHNGALNCLQWLCERPPAVGCEGECDGERSLSFELGVQAIRNGDLQLAQYLTGLYDSQTLGGMDRLARDLGSRGHLPLVQWFFMHRHDYIDWAIVRSTSRRNVVAWLDAQERV